MDVVLDDVLYCCQAYDDIVVFSSSSEDYCSHLTVVLETSGCWDNTEDF